MPHEVRRATLHAIRQTPKSDYDLLSDRKREILLLAEGCAKYNFMCNMGLA